VKFYAAQEFSRCVRIRWNDLSDRFTAFRYDKRLASPGDVVDKREAVSLELTRGLFWVDCSWSNYMTMNEVRQRCLVGSLRSAPTQSGCNFGKTDHRNLGDCSPWRSNWTVSPFSTRSRTFEAFFRNSVGDKLFMELAN